MNCYLTCPCIPIFVSHGHILKPITGPPAAPPPSCPRQSCFSQDYKPSHFLPVCVHLFSCQTHNRIFFLHYYFLKKHEVNSKRHVPLLEPCFDRNAADPSHFKKMLVWLLKPFFNKTINCSIKLRKKKYVKQTTCTFAPSLEEKHTPCARHGSRHKATLGPWVN